jgi:hypothetical protein
MLNETLMTQSNLAVAQQRFCNYLDLLIVNNVPFNMFEIQDNPGVGIIIDDADAWNRYANRAKVILQGHGIAA